ncbi:MAG TPA: efflux RND transporter periplasmic adaptor subunit [Aggregatilineaceae bacterium]|nr:efflux RND transporter periplasmic adaptor subunit [Aggregatilineaceae bacterium]
MWLLVLGVLLAGWGAYLLAGKPVQSKKAAAVEAVPTAEIRLGAVERTLRVAGQTSARNYASIVVARFRGQPGMGRGGNLVLTKLTPGGTKVKAGDVVAELDTENMLNTIDDLRSNLEQTRLDVQRQRAQQILDWTNLNQTVRASKSTRDKAAWDYKAAEVKTPIEQELLKLSMEQTAAQYQQQIESLTYKRVSLDAQLRMSELTLQRQQLRYKHSLNDLAGFTFRAPMDGLVVLQSVERSGGNTAQYAVGDGVNPGRAFMKIVDTSTMQLEARASQAEASALRIGQQAVVTLDAFPGLTFPGRVYSVGAIAVQGMRESYYVRTVTVNVRIQGQDSRLIPDLSGAAEVRLERQESKCIVPLEALRSEGSRSFVYVRVGPLFEKRYVQVGLQNATHAAVLSGLSAGDRVAMTQPPAGT